MHIKDKSLVLLLVACLASFPSTVAEAGSTLNFGTYTYDPSGNIHRIHGTIGPDTFVYDVYGRLSSGTHSMPSPATPVSQSHTFDRYGNIESIVTTGRPNRILAVDKNSNQLDSGSVAGANVKGTYDTAGNQLTFDRGGVTGRFEYDALNVATESTIAGARKLYLYSASDERLASISVTPAGALGAQQWTVREPGGQVLRRFIRANGTEALQWEEDYVYRGAQMLAAFVPSPEKVLHFHPDHLGSPRLITGNGGAQVAEHRYYAFGEELTSRLAGAEEKKFTGHERDTVSDALAGDVDYMHARYYGWWEGRFLAVDPGPAELERPQTWNRYAYVMNNPMLYNDPTGTVYELYGFMQDAAEQMFFKNLRAKTGLTLTNTNGKLEYAKDANGKPIVDKDANGKPLGSAKARTDLVNGIDSTTRFVVQRTDNSPTVDMGWRTGALIRLDFADMGEINTGSNAAATFDPAMIFLHEGVGHAFLGLKDPTPAQLQQNHTLQGATVKWENQIRTQLGLPLRNQYRAEVQNGKRYIPFANGPVWLP